MYRFIVFILIFLIFLAPLVFIFSQNPDDVRKFYNPLQQQIGSTLGCGGSATTAFGKLWNCIFEAIDNLKEIALVLFALAIIVSGGYYLAAPVVGTKHIETAKKILIWSTIGFIIIFTAELIRLQTEKIFKQQSGIIKVARAALNIPELKQKPKSSGNCRANLNVQPYQFVKFLQAIPKDSFTLYLFQAKERNVPYKIMHRILDENNKPGEIFCTNLPDVYKPQPGVVPLYYQVRWILIGHEYEIRDENNTNFQQKDGIRLPDAPEYKPNYSIDVMYGIYRSSFRTKLLSDELYGRENTQMDQSGNVKFRVQNIIYQDHREQPNVAYIYQAVGFIFFGSRLDNLDDVYSLDMVKSSIYVLLPYASTTEETNKMIENTTKNEKFEKLSENILTTLPQYVQKIKAELTVTTTPVNIAVLPPGVGQKPAAGLLEQAYPSPEHLIQNKFLNIIVENSPYLFVVLLIVGGLFYLFAPVQLKQVEKAHKIIKYAVWGYILLLTMTAIFSAIKAIFNITR